MNFGSDSVLALACLLFLAHRGTCISVDGPNRPSRNLIVGGTPVKSKAVYPGFVWSGIGDGGWGCGGALIHPDIVLTAAHCEWVFRGRGAYVGATQIDGSDGVHFGDEEIRVHPDYDDPSHLHDVMLIKLAGTSEARTFKYNSNVFYPSVGDVVSIIGFGMTSEDGLVSDVLREVDVNVVSYPNCKEVYKDSYRIVDELFLCAGTNAGGRDACDSDSGSPLFVDDVVVAVTGDGIGCGRPGIPSTNARVSADADWIGTSICDMSSVPPESCSSGTGVDVEKQKSKPWAISRSFVFLAVLLGGVLVAAAVSRSAAWTKSFLRRDTSYEEIPAIDMVEAR